MGRSPAAPIRGNRPKRDFSATRRSGAGGSRTPDEGSIWMTIGPGPPAPLRVTFTPDC